MRCSRARFRRARTRSPPLGGARAARRRSQPPAGAARAPPLPLAPRQGSEAEQGWLLPRCARARPPLPSSQLPPGWRGRRGSRCRGGRLPILMVLGNPARASPSSPASSSRRVRGALCPIFFSPCGSAPKPKLAAQAWAQLETRSGVNGGGDAGGGGGEDGPPPFVSFFFILSFPKSLCSRLHPSLAGLIGCEIAFLPRRQQPPPQRRDFPQRWWVAEPPRLLRPGREGVIDQTWREAGWQPLRCARPARPAPAAPAAAQRSGLRSAGAHRPHVGRPPGCSCPFKAASARCVCVCMRERVRCVRLWAGGGGSGERKEGRGAEPGPAEEAGVVGRWPRPARAGARARARWALRAPLNLRAGRQRRRLGAGGGRPGDGRGRRVPLGPS